MANANGLIIFDCDGVLVDSEPIAARILAEYISTNGRATTTDECIKTFTGLSLKSVEHIVASEWGVLLPDNFVEELRALDRAAFEIELKPLPAVTDAINTIKNAGKNAGLKICVASSGSREKITHSLSVTGLIDLFDNNIFSADEVTNGKPAPDLFLYAAGKMAVDANNTLVIEDSPAGIVAAKNAGMGVFGFTGGGHAGTDDFKARLKSAQPDKCFSHMGQLAKLLDI